MKLYACHNKPRDFADYPAQDGWFYEYSGMTRKPRITSVPHVMSKDCRYDNSNTDKQCAGCQHAPVDAEMPKESAPTLSDVLHAAAPAEIAQAITPSAEGAPAQTPSKEVAWEVAQRICDLPRVDEAIRNLLADQTGDNATCMVREILEAAQTAPAVPEGWKLVPECPTREMQQAWDTAPCSEDIDAEFRGAYYAMIAAAPSAPSEDAGWLPIETAPKDGSRIMLGCPESEEQCAISTIGWWQEAEEDGVDYMGADAGFVDFAFQVFNPGRSFGNPTRMYAADQPTHWMPLPPAPLAATAQQKEGE